MVFDFVVLSLLCLALVAGFEKGLFRSFSLLIAGSLAIVVSLSLTPGMIQFLEQSMGHFSIQYQFLATIAMFCLIALLIYHLLQAIATHQTKGYIRQFCGSLVLLVMMLMSIGIITGFLQESGVVSKQGIEASYSAKVVIPIKKGTEKVWEKAITGADAIRHRSAEQRQANLSSIN